MIDREKFFAALVPVPLPRPRKPSQVRTLDAILDEADRRKVTDLRWVADMMGTALGETGINLAPVREGFKTTDAEARAYVKRRGYRYAVVINGHCYYGRGLVQATWLDNYKKLTVIAREQFEQGLFPDLTEPPDFVNNPDLLLQPRWAVWAMFEGMIRGTFTKKKLADFYNDTTTDFVNSRKIINGLDRAAEIGGYKKQFYADLVASNV